MIIDQIWYLVAFWIEEAIHDLWSLVWYLNWFRFIFGIFSFVLIFFLEVVVVFFFFDGLKLWLVLLIWWQSAQWSIRYFNWLLLTKIIIIIWRKVLQIKFHINLQVYVGINGFIAVSWECKDGLRKLRVLLWLACCHDITCVGQIWELGFLFWFFTFENICYFPPVLFFRFLWFLFFQEIELIRSTFILAGYFWHVKAESWLVKWASMSSCVVPLWLISCPKCTWLRFFLLCRAHRSCNIFDRLNNDLIPLLIIRIIRLLRLLLNRLGWIERHLFWILFLW